MAVTQSSQIVLQANGTLTSSDGTSNQNDVLAAIYTQLFSNGTGVNQAAEIFHKAGVTVAASSSTTYVLGSGAITDVFGNAISFVRVVALIVKAAVGNTNNVLVGAAGTNPFVAPFGGTTPTVTVRPGGVMVLLAPDATGYVVTGGSAEQLKLANSSSGTSVTFDITIIGN